MSEWAYFNQFSGEDLMVYALAAVWPGRWWETVIVFFEQ